MRGTQRVYHTPQIEAHLANNTEGVIATEFNRLDTRRTGKIQRAQDCSRLTVPGLFPEEGFSETMELPDVFSSLPARGVMSLSSRMVSAIYPLNQAPFFNFELDQAFVPQGADPTETMSSLSRLDRKIMDKLSSTNLRQELFVLFQHLIVVGDALFECLDDYNFRIHRLDQYVVCRYPDGRVKRIILREWVDPEAVPEDWPEVDTHNRHDEAYSNGPTSDHLPFYTDILWDSDEKKWYVTKEYCGVVVDEGTYDINPYIPQSWSRVAGEDYGRSLVEEHIGDIRTLETITKALVEAAVANSEFRIGVDPSGFTEVSDLQETSNGDFVPARAVDVFPIQLLKQIDIGPMAEVRQDLTQQIGRTFLLQSSVQRTGDRVTATEIREVAQELDQALGGIFSGLARDIQIPIVKRAMVLMARDQLVPKELMKLIQGGGPLSLKVRTGLEALNREVTNSQLAQWAQVVGQMQAVQPYIDWYGWAIKWTSSFGLEPVGLVKTPQQLQEEQQQQAQQSLQQMGAQQAISSMGAMAESGAANAQQQGQPQ